MPLPAKLILLVSNRISLPCLMSSAARFLFRPDRDQTFRAHRDYPFRTSDDFFDRHQIGIHDRDHLGTVIFISSE
jgi:hypothetical protein